MDLKCFQTASDMETSRVLDTARMFLEKESATTEGEKDPSFVPQAVLSDDVSRAFYAAAVSFLH